MNESFTLDELPKSDTLDPNYIDRLYKLNLMCKFMVKKSNEPRLTQKQNCNQLGFSDSSNKRYRDDIQMNSPYNRNNQKKRFSKRKANTNITSTQDLTTNESSKSSSNKKTKNNVIKRGDLSNIHISCKELIEQAFS